MTEDLVKKIDRALPQASRIDCVVGPALGAITIAHDMARHIASYKSLGSICRRAYTEKDPKSPNERMLFTRTIVHPGERVLLVEDVLTTGGSIERAAEAVRAAGGIPLPFVCALVNRSGEEELDGRKVIALVTRHIPSWSPEDCPLCAAGSEAIRPKGKESWERLTRAY